MSSTLSSAAPSNPILSATGVNKLYQLGSREVSVLRDVDFVVQRGEFVALRGASGAGKSTLLNILGGLDVADKGRVLFKEIELSRMGNSELSTFRNHSVGFVFQSFCLLPELDALENVALPARIAGTSFGDASARAAVLLERVGLKHRMDHRPPELSGGEQQRVAIARALTNHPEILLADEPTGNLDSHTGQEIMQVLVQICREDGLTLIIATHDANLAGKADRVVNLVDGAIAIENV